MRIETYGAPHGTRGIGEASFGDLIAAVEAASDVLNSRKKYWISAVRQLAGYLGLPPSTIPARMSAISGKVRGLHPNRLGVNPKTFANVRANAVAAINWFCGVHDVGRRRVSIDDDYRALLAAVSDQHCRDVFMPFVRFLSARGVAPAHVNDDHLRAYAEFRAATHYRGIRPTMLRQIVKICAEVGSALPSANLAQLSGPACPPSHAGPSESDFPLGLRQDIDSYLDLMSKRHRTADNRIMRGCAATTLELRRREFAATVRMAVKVGVPLKNLTSLRELLKPATARMILDSYWAENGAEPSAYAIDLAGRFYSVARMLNVLSNEELAGLDDIRRALESHRPKDKFTDKNLETVRQTLVPGRWAAVRDLPAKLMAEARAQRKSMPIRAAITAQLAAAVRILVVAPIRMRNLGNIRIDENLVRPGGPGSPHTLFFADYDVKNRVRLEMPFDEETARIVDEYVNLHRPALMRGRNHDYLFPGKARDRKGIQGLSELISDRLWKELGLKITAHQFRHAAAAIYLKHRPGADEDVRRILGHKTIKTTLDFYTALEAPEAVRRFTGIVEGLSKAKDRP